MKASELRIGNKSFRGGLFGEPQVVVTISAMDILELSTYENIAHDFVPIPINSEWLIKAGFIDSSGMAPIGTFFKRETSLGYSIGVSLFANQTIINIIGTDFELTNIQYVHQLQNFIFDIESK